MPLLDHFHGTLDDERSWSSFHAAWANAIMGRLNEEILPPRYFAEAHVHLGGAVEVDVGTMEGGSLQPAPGNGPGGVLTLAAWAPPAPPLTLAAVFPDEIEVRVIRREGGPQLVAAVELVSLRNKDRAEAQRAFAVKCASYLQAGVGLLVVDVVTSRHANLHNELMTLLDAPATHRLGEDADLYAVSFRPIRRETEGDQIDLWPVPLGVGEALPVMPLTLLGGPTLPLDLEATYAEARRRSRL